jgi:hypothetical protein
MDRAGVGRIAFALCLLTMASDAMPQTAGDSRSYRRDRRGRTGGVVASVRVCVSGPRADDWQLRRVGGRRHFCAVSSMTTSRWQVTCSRDLPPDNLDSGSSGKCSWRS